MGLERQIGILHHLVDHLPGHAGVDATTHVHAAQLGRLTLGAMAERPPLDIELAFHQLTLGGHGEVLPRGHGERAGDQPGHPGQSDNGRAGVGPGDAHDQRDIGDQAVADPEDRRPGSTTAHVTVVMGCRHGVVSGGAHARQRSEAPVRG